MTTLLEPGIYRNLPTAEYHALPYASNSRLNALRRSPAHLRAAMEEPGESTTALRIGRAVHTSILEPDLFDREFVVAEQCGGITKDGKGPRCTNAGAVLTDAGWRCGIHMKGLSPSAEARVVMKLDDLAMCYGVREAVRAHPLAANLLRAATDVELTLIWDDPETGVRIKARADIYAPGVRGGSGILGDLKSTDDARPDAFARSAFTYGYFSQASLYLDGAAACGLDVERFAFVACEKQRPFGVVVYEPDQDALIHARAEIKALLRTWATCRALNEWPCYPVAAQLLTMPAWAWGRAALEPLTMETAVA